jgi:hypothetical protein
VSRVPHPMAVARRVAAGVGLDDVIRLGRRVDALADSVAENARLEGPLTDLVAGLERSLVGPLELRQQRLAELEHRG